MNEEVNYVNQESPDNSQENRKPIVKKGLGWISLGAGLAGLSVMLGAFRPNHSLGWTLLYDWLVFNGSHFIKSQKRIKNRSWISPEPILYFAKFYGRFGKITFIGSPSRAFKNSTKAFFSCAFNPRGVIKGLKFSFTSPPLS